MILPTAQLLHRLSSPESTSQGVLDSCQKYLQENIPFTVEEDVLSFESIYFDINSTRLLKLISDYLMIRYPEFQQEDWKQLVLISGCNEYHIQHPLAVFLGFIHSNLVMSSMEREFLLLEEEIDDEFLDVYYKSRNNEIDIQSVVNLN